LVLANLSIDGFEMNKIQCQIQPRADRTMI